MPHPGPSRISANIRARLRDTRRRKVSPCVPRIAMPPTPPPKRGEEGQGGGDVGGDACGNEEVGSMRKQLESLSIVEQQLVVFTRGSRQPSSSAALGNPPSLSDGGVVEHSP